MAVLERTAYPRFPRVITPQDLQNHFTPSNDEVTWARREAPRLDRAWTLLVLLKCHRYLHYFPSLKSIPEDIALHVAACIGATPRARVAYPSSSPTPLHRDHQRVRSFLGVSAWSARQGGKVAFRLAQAAAKIVDDRPDIINVVIDGLIRENWELPAFSTVDKLSEVAYAAAHEELFAAVAGGLTTLQKQSLDRLLRSDLPSRTSQYNQIKKQAKRTSRQHLLDLIEQLAWLESIDDPDPYLAPLPTSKRKHLAFQAAQYDAAELKDLKPNKRYTMILALLKEMKSSTRDSLAEMYIRRVSAIHKSAREKLEELQLHQRELTESLVATLDDVLEVLSLNLDDASTGRRVRDLLAPNDDLEKLREDCAAIRTWSGNNYLPLTWKEFRPHRSTLFKLARTLEFEAATQDRSLIDALEVILANEDRKQEWIEDEVVLTFASERWRKLVRRSHGHGPPTHRRYLEVCVFSHLASELKSGDICVVGSEIYSDYRKQLLPWKECRAKLPEFCARIEIPSTPEGFVEHLRQLLEKTAQRVDEHFPEHSGDVVIGSNGEPVLKRVTAREIPPSAIALETALSQRMTPRNLLDIMANIEHWTGFTRHFGPFSGSEPKIRGARERYLLTAFAMGCNLGPTQASRHLSNGVSAHQLAFINRRHISQDGLDAANRELAELYLKLDLPTAWGDKKKVAADGTQYDFYDNNLLAGYHFRYRKMGAVAYRHVGTNYIAYFRHFIPPGMNEALFVIDGLTKSGLSAQPDVVFSDTHGQSETVWTFTYTHGIQLMPRIRNWKDLHLYKASPKTKYKHIERLFDASIDWDLIRDHFQDIMQAAISVQEGRVPASLLLRRLSQDGRHNRLFLASREVGRVLRSVYLLNWISDRNLRQEVTAQTNKIESYHAFSKWLSFGGDVIPVNDPIEQQKRIRYIDLVASCVILQNTIDMTRILQDLHGSGHSVTGADIAFLSPYMTSGVKRFGNYTLDLKRPPEPWIRDTVLRDIVRQVHRSQGMHGEQRDRA